MATVVRIDDAADPRLEDFRALSDADVRPDRRGVVIAEGQSVVERLLGSPYPVRAVIGEAHRIEALAPYLAGHDVPAFSLDKWLLSEVVGFRVTRGVLASATRPSPLTVDEVVAAATRLVVLEGLNDFENLGSLFRNAAAFGIDGVLLDDRCADPLYRRSVRVSMGHVLRVPFAVLRPGARDGGAPEALAQLADRGFATVALTPSGPVDLRDLPVLPAWAAVLGAEGPGLTEAAMAAATVRARIPMATGVDSLNVATAAAVAFSHLTAAR
ncbi:MAG: putative tRNA/rRNA methyltransferase Rv0881 [Jatrophihabitantaceae bacterium]|nr:putative tRNA/rRNA methyltransferase Rv0881 [Jatrophihabitantaceae bacterium]